MIIERAVIIPETDLTTAQSPSPHEKIFADFSLLAFFAR
jgi:hypothetical protein